jgi:DNA-directed RNA polymerase subunit RPC12/RpoP
MFYVVIALVFGLAGGLVGRSKGSSFVIWFLVAAAVPMIGLVAALLYRSEDEEPDRACPRCGARCKVYAALCMRCGMELEFPEEQDSATIGTAAA